MKYKKQIVTGVMALSLVVGTLSMMNSDGFVLEVINARARTMSSIDVKINDETVYNKNGLKTSVSELSPGQKVIVAGYLDKTANVLITQEVKIVK